jgi:isopenicillin N synthase-like dioxygenase
LPTWPPQLRGLIEAWWQDILKLTDRLTRLAALALDLPEDYFATWYYDPAIVLRFVYYPDQRETPKPGQLRYGAHHDYGGLTILRQDPTVGGLEVCSPEGVWCEVRPIPESFVVNVGDLLARWTNDRWRSTLHRVANPDRNLIRSTARLSMVAFTAPHESSEIGCLPSCCSARKPARYAPVNAGAYVHGKLDASMDIGLKN